MTKLFTKVQNAIAARRNDEEGAAMVEYGLLVAGIAVVAWRCRRSARHRDQRSCSTASIVLMSSRAWRERSPVGDRSRCPNFIFRDRPKEVCHEETNT